MDHMVPATRSAAEKAYRKIESINVAVGNFFFQYRNGLFPVIFILAALTLRPSIMFNSPLADRLIGASGMIIILLGEAVRLVTIGFEYIHRGGKERRVYAGRLVQGGVFGLVRNPMYIGNVLDCGGDDNVSKIAAGIYHFNTALPLPLSGVDRSGGSVPA